MKVCPTCSHLYPTSAVVCPKDGALLNILREWQSGDTVVDRFTIIEKLGHGSLGPAFRAKALPVGGTRVLKCLPVRLAIDEDLLEHFHREIQAVRGLRHPNVICLESLEKAPDGRSFIVMEYGAGYSLRELLVRGGYIPAQDVVGIMEQVCAAMVSAHAMGCIHRNLKPDNILVAEGPTKSAQVKVLELGMANLRQIAAEKGKHVGDVVVTDQSVIVGTMEYMSPEQSVGALASALDGRSDLYSMGVIMFEALTGELPIATEDPVGLLRQRQDGAANDLLCRTVMRSLQSDPDLRCQSAADMLAALREVSHSLGRTSPVAVVADLEERASAVAAPHTPTQHGTDAGRRPPLRPATQERREASIPHRGTPPPPNLTPRVPTTISEENFDEIRKAWERNPRSGSGKAKSETKLLKTGAFVLGLALACCLIWWEIHRGGPPQPVPSGENPAGGATAKQVPAPGANTVQDPGALGVQPSTVVSSPGETQSSTDKPMANLPTVDESVKAKTSPGQVASDGPQPGLRPTVTKAAGTPEALVKSPESMSPSEREAEIKGKIAAGWSQMERGETIAAIESFSFALQLDPSNVEAKAALRLARFASQHPNQNVLPPSAPADGKGSEKGQP
jgi:serine/threonine protein kinase